MLLSDTENKAADDFAMGHYKDHCHSKNKLAAVRVTAEQTSIGYKITVQCPYCKQEKDVTDYSVW